MLGEYFHEALSASVVQAGLASAHTLFPAPLSPLEGDTSGSFVIVKVDKLSTTQHGKSIPKQKIESSLDVELATSYDDSRPATAKQLRQQLLEAAAKRPVDASNKVGHALLLQLRKCIRKTIQKGSDTGMRPQDLKIADVTPTTKQGKTLISTKYQVEVIPKDLTQTVKQAEDSISESATDDAQAVPFSNAVKTCFDAAVQQHVVVANTLKIEITPPPKETGKSKAGPLSQTTCMGSAPATLFTELERAVKRHLNGNTQADTSSDKLLRAFKASTAKALNETLTNSKTIEPSDVIVNGAKMSSNGKCATFTYQVSPKPADGVSAQAAAADIEVAVEAEDASATGGFNDQLKNEMNTQTAATGPEADPLLNVESNVSDSVVSGNTTVKLDPATTPETLGPRKILFVPLCDGTL
jgi:hypothetical protein